VAPWRRGLPSSRRRLGTCRVHARPSRQRPWFGPGPRSVPPGRERAAFAPRPGRTYRPDRGGLLAPV